MTLALTRHAEQRMAQRCIKPEQIELAMLIAHEVPDGFLVRDNDARQAAALLREMAAVVDRLAGTRFVIQADQLVTAYHATPATKRRLLRDKTHRHYDKGGRT